MHKVASKPQLGDELREQGLADAQFLARWCPALRRHEPGLLLLQETWEGVSRHSFPDSMCCMVFGGDREQPGRVPV